MRTLILLGLMSLFAAATAQEAPPFLVPYAEGSYAVPGTAHSVDYEIQVPRSLHTVAPGHAFPVVVVFDRQNAYGYAYILHTLNYLMAMGGAPASIVIGVGFTPANRLPLTLTEAGGGNMEAFIDGLAGLVGQVEAWGVQAGPVLLVGHSRTGGLAWQALARRPDLVHGALAASPGGISPAQRAAYRDFVAQLRTIERPRYLFLSSGDSTHLEDEAGFRQLTACVDSFPLPGRLVVRHALYPCDHILGRTIDLLPSLNAYYQPYTLALNQALVAYDSGHFAFDSTAAILGRQATVYSVEDVFLYSAHSRLMQEVEAGRWGAAQLAAFEDFVAGYGRVYPRDPFLHELAASLAQERGDTALAQARARQALNCLEAYLWESEAERTEYAAYLEETFLTATGE